MSRIIASFGEESSALKKKKAFSGPINVLQLNVRPAALFG